MKLKNCFAIVLTLLMAFTVVSGHASDQKKVSPQVTTHITTIEAKEAYKVDDAEYTVALYSKPNIGQGAGYGSEGIMLLGGIAMLVGLFKRDPLLIGLVTVALVSYFVTSQHEVGVSVLAIAPALKIDLKGLEGDEFKQEREFLERVGKRINVEAGDVSKKDVEDAVKVLSEEIKGIKGLNVEKLNEILDEKKGAMSLLIKQGLELNELKLKGSTIIDKKDWKKLINDQFTNEDKLKRMEEVANGGAGMAHVFGNPDKFSESPGVVQKAGTMTTAIVTTDSGGNALLDLMSVEDLRSINLQDPFIENFSSVGRTSKPVYPYADFQPNTGDAAFTAENAAKSQMDLKVVVKTVGPKKVTGYSTLSTEVVEDVPRMQSEATNYILKKVLLKRQSKILFGTGAGSDPNGVAGLAKTYNQAGLLDNAGAALAGSLILQANGNGVPTANLYDVIAACALQIFSVANYADENEYYPNLVILNPTDLATLKLKKNAFGQYLFPELVFNQGTNPVKIGNLSVIAKRQVPVGKIMIGDFSRLNIINYIDYTVRIGWINDNLINNLFTMVGESRFFTVIRSLDQNAFIYDDIATIIGAIQAP